MAASLQAARDEITASIQALPPDSTPGKKQAIKSLFILSKSVYRHMSRVLQESGIEEPPSEVGEEGPHQETAEDHDSDPPAEERDERSQPQKIYDDALAIYNEKDNAITMDEFITILVQNNAVRTTLAVKETMGLVYLLRGYWGGDDVEDLRKKITSRLSADRTIAHDEVYSKSITNESNNDVVDKLLTREKIMVQCEHGSILSGFLNAVLGSIQCICFAKEWAKLHKREKRDFVEKAFEQYDPDFLSEAEDDTVIARKKVFKNRHKKVITSRNELLKMFEKFHCAVLMDPYWMPKASYELGGLGRTKHFAATWDLISTNCDDLSYEEAERNQDAFTQVMDVLLSKDAYLYIRRFLQQNPYM
ncbi:hypothetical protein D9613_004289 [Agrocybe pediades]|uniref:Uncharacterized protein n=1 Tax=Agrocybe pediades TaxID=84607 RepID=A0A8H4QJ33_9AGAR|nr:hypothetical protein D9613_004289 [Agrocybe pediades]